MIRPYEKYIDSGFEWVGLIPNTWGKTQLKFIAAISKGRKPRVDFEEFQDGMVPYLSMEFLRSQTESPVYVYADSPEIVLVEEEDLLILWDGSKAGEIVKAKKGALSSTMGKIHLESGKISPRFLAHYLKNAEKQLQDNTVGMGIPHVNGEELKSLFIPVPPLSEQTQIAAFLDYQTGLIDALIEKKEKLVELLKEKRQAVINEAVTKGLNPQAKMKNSGIEWLGEVPEGWDVKRLRFLGKCQNGVSQGGEYFGSGDPFVSYGDVYKNMSLPLEVVGLANSTSSDKEVYSVLEGDIFFTRTSETIEEIGFASTCLQTILNAVFAGFLIRFRPTSNIIDKNFSKYYFRSHIPRVFFIKEMNLVTRASLSQELLKSLPVLLPSLGQQKEIGSFLDIKVNQFNTLIAGLYGVILKLKEYRQSLISEAVTGKIDVREWQKPEVQLS